MAGRIFWPMDYIIYEIASLVNEQRFVDRDTQILGASWMRIVHLAWRNDDHPDLKDLPFPMLADANVN